MARDTATQAKKAPRDAGSGGLYQDTRGYWTAAVSLPPGADGKRRRKVIRRRLKADALAELRELRKGIDQSGDMPTASPTVAQWLRAWIERRAEDDLKPTTAKMYRGVITRYIVPTIGQVRLERLTTDDVRKVKDYIVKTKKLSSTTALNAHRVLAKALTDAVREGKVGRNVATLIDAPPKALGTRGALTAEQAQALLLSSVSSPRDAASWSVALLTGLRQGERLGMTREFIDLDRGIITVSWQLQRLTWDHGCGAPAPDGAWPCGRTRGGSCPERRLIVPADHEVKQVHGGLWMTRPKSRKSWREVPIAPPLHAVLDLYLKGTKPGKEGLVFHRDDEERNPIDPKTDSASWHAALEQAGLPSVPLHAARHTTATLLFKLGVPEQTRVAILGHSSATVTAGYTHISTEEMAEAMSRLGGLLTAS